MTAAVLLLCALLAADDAVVARVNGTPITARMVNEIVKGVIAGRKVPPDSAEIAKLTDAALTSAIDLELLYQAAGTHGIRVSEAQIDAAIARNRARFAKAADYDAALARSGLTPATLRAETRKALTVDALLERVVWKDVRVAPDAAQQYYDANRAALGGKPFATLKPAIDAALRDEARERARAAYVAELRKTAQIEADAPPAGTAPAAAPTRAAAGG